MSSINDITSYLYAQQLEQLQQTAAGSRTASDTSSVSTDFASLLTSEVSNYSEGASLVSTLDKSVLGSLGSSMDLSALSEELLSTSSGREVVAKLAEGHLDAIAMSDGDDDDDDSGLSSLTDSYTETVSETDELSEILDKLSDIAADGGSEKE